MSFLETARQLITKNPKNIKEPLFYKCEGLINPYNRDGAEAIYHTLKDSGLPVIILPGLYLENEGKEAFIDFLIISMKYILIVDCYEGKNTVSQAKEHFIRKILLEWLPENRPVMWDFLLKSVVVSPKDAPPKTGNGFLAKSPLIYKDRLVRYLRNLKRSNTADFWIPEEGLYVIADIILKYKIMT